MESKVTKPNDRVTPCDDDESTNSSSDNRLGKAAAGLAVGAVGLGATGEAAAWFWNPSRVIIPDGPAPCTGVCGPQATEFQTIIDNEATTRFRRMDWSNPLDWLIIATSSSSLHKINADKAIINLLRQCNRYSFGMPVNVLQHCLQTATRAARASASDEMVLAALLHDVGIAISYPGHAQISASIIRPFVSEAVYKTVFHHHEFELAHYGHRIGESTTMRDLYLNQPWYATAAKFVDEWVQVSYDPSYDSYPLKDFKPLIKEKFAPYDTESMNVTMSDCFREDPA
ncbi:HD domain-containing protein [Alcanivorax sp. 1008]|uniref:HD domain-containing protein n=1 Tax=Alcanivorax sp. 1008 TaxID=2816853 RepID=UPI001D75A652|nr:HD domain-containing protein [Alcanivorax sp. 1008]MCC1495328.1 HD domain-containing protein [Alcanivorax sp. 1008]